jgi:hypothetical protein
MFRYSYCQRNDVFKRALGDGGHVQPVDKTSRQMPQQVDEAGVPC